MTALSHDDDNHKSFLKKIYTKNLKYLAGLTRKTGTPIHLTEDEQTAYVNAHYVPTKNRYPFMVYNIKTSVIVTSGGFQMALGWPAVFDYYFFLEQVHPNYLSPFVIWGMAAYTLAYDDAFRKSISHESHQHRVSIPLRNLTNGEYYWVLQEATPTQVDQAGLLVSHINKYTIQQPFSEYGKIPFEAIVYNEQRVEKRIMEEFIKLISQYLYEEFKPRQKQLIEILLQSQIQQQQITAKVIAEKMKITVAAVRKHYDNILSTGNLIIGTRFSNAVELIEYCLHKKYLPFTDKQKA